MTDLDFFCWRFAVKDDESEDRLVHPHSDHWGDGEAITLIFATADEAVEWRNELLSDMDLGCLHCGVDIEYHEDAWWHSATCPRNTGCYGGNTGAEPEEEPVELSWKLVHYEGKVVL